MKVLMLSRDTLFSGPGGDTVQMTETARALRELGVEVEILKTSEKVEYELYDLIHFFNITRVSAILPHLNKGLPYVLSPIFVDFSEYDTKHRKGIVGWSARMLGRDASEYIKVIARWLINRERVGSVEYVIRGQKKTIEKVLNGANALLPNSESEMMRLKKAYSFKSDLQVVPNGVNIQYLESKESGERSGVLCVGRIEPYKNQHRIIEAVNGTGIPLTIIGKAAPNHKDYYLQCRKMAGEEVTFVDHMPHDELMKEYSRHKVHVSVSWFETTGLCNLEAAWMGCSLVITDRGDTTDYFGVDAEYCQPDDLHSIRSAILRAMEKDASASLQQRIRERYNWEVAARITLQVYQRVLNV